MAHPLCWRLVKLHKEGRQAAFNNQLWICWSSYKASVVATMAGKEAEWTFKWIMGSFSKQIFFHFSVARECCCFSWLCSLISEQSSFPDHWYLLEAEICLEMFPAQEKQPGEVSLQVAVTQKKTVVWQFHWGTNASLSYFRNLCHQDMCTELNITNQARGKQDL